MQRHAPAAERNRGPILEVLQRVLPPRGRALELASGSGQHVVHFAQHLPGWHFTPSDPDPSARASIDAWVASAGVDNVDPARDIDARRQPWGVDALDAVLAINMVHIAPWEATVGLLQGAAKVLRPKGQLVLYGPYIIDGETAPSNRQFDASLRARDPSWGVRELSEIVALASEHGLALAHTVPMPANNHTVVFARSP